jgi:hypothetical protein
VKNAGKLLDLTLVEDKNAVILAIDDAETQKKIFKNYTSGHFSRGVL